VPEGVEISSGLWGGETVEREMERTVQTMVEIGKMIDSHEQRRIMQPTGCKGVNGFGKGDVLSSGFHMEAFTWNKPLRLEAGLGQ